MMMLSLILEHASATYNVSQMCQKPKICFEILNSLCWNGLCSSWHQVFLLCRKWWWTWMVKSLYFSISARLFSSSSLCCLWRSRYRSSSRKYLILRQISKFFGVKITLKFLALASNAPPHYLDSMAIGVLGFDIRSQRSQNELAWIYLEHLNSKYL